MTLVAAYSGRVQSPIREWRTTSAQAEQQLNHNESVYREGRSLLREVEKSLTDYHMLRDAGIYIKSDDRYEKCATLIFTDSLRLFHAFLILFQAGHLEAGAILTRSLFERLVDALYISKASRIRLQRYLDYWHVNRGELFVAIKTHMNFPEESDTDRIRKYKEVTEEGAKLRKRYKHWATKHHWSGKPMRERCEIVGLLSHYEIVVHEYSSFTHSDPVSSQATLSGLTKYGGFTCSYKGKEKKSTKEFEFALTNVIKFELLLWVIFSKALKIELERNVVRALEKMRRMKEWSSCFRGNRVLWR